MRLDGRRRNPFRIASSKLSVANQRGQARLPNHELIGVNLILDLRAFKVGSTPGLKLANAFSVIVALQS